MSLGDYCNVSSFELTERSIDLIHQINNKVDIGNSLAIVTSTHVIANVFANPTPRTVIENIHDYEWEEFGEAMGSIHDITRRQVFNLVENHLFFSNDNSEFWKCVREATR